jgi:hypothetical protein
MLATIKNWFKDNNSTGESNSANQTNGTGRHAIARQSIKKPANAAASKRVQAPDAHKKAPARHQYIREETSTHETLTILDSSLPDPDEENGIDPYNTGGFDRSKNWNNRFRK